MKNVLEVLVIRVKRKQKEEIESLSQRYEISKSLIARKALAVGLKNFESALVASARKEG